MPLIPRDQTDAENNVRTAWMAGAIQAIMLLSGGLIDVASGEVAFTQTVAVVLFGQVIVQTVLTIGLWARSRVAAVAMLMFFVLTCLIRLTVEGFSWMKLIVPSLFFIAYLMGITGTFASQRQRLPAPRRAAPLLSARSRLRGSVHRR